MRDDVFIDPAYGFPRSGYARRLGPEPLEHSDVLRRVSRQWTCWQGRIPQLGSPQRTLQQTRTHRGTAHEGKYKLFSEYPVIYDIDGLVQKRRNSRALAMELRLSCINPSI